MCDDYLVKLGTWSISDMMIVFYLPADLCLLFMMDDMVVDYHRDHSFFS